jgi:3-oxoisoapionate decarboxylase
VSVFVRFGLDTYSLAAQNWTAWQHLDFAAKWNLNVVHFSERRFLGSLDRGHLTKVRARADALGIDLEIGMRSICPTSRSFDHAAGSPEAQIGHAIAAARILRSPILRAFVGSSDDRDGGIERHIDETVNVLRRVRTRVMDAGVKLAIENHAGDLQARELKTLVETAGPEFVGVCLDSGNPTWALEDPHLTLETLAPYVLTSHIRDSAVWRTPDGIAVRWTRMGEGNVGIADYIAEYVRRCPGKAASLEVIVTAQPRLFNYAAPGLWSRYRDQPAWEFARFLALADKGTPVLEPPTDSAEDPATTNLANVEASIGWMRSLLASL